MEPELKSGTRKRKITQAVPTKLKIVISWISCVRFQIEINPRYCLRLQFIFPNRESDTGL